MNKILIIDDELDVRNSLCEIVTSQGYSCVLASNGAEGLEIYKRESPDLALLDMKMPGMSGFEVLIELKKADEDFPVIMVTAHSDVATAVEAIKHGAYDFIIKPADIEKLLITIKNACRNLEVIKENKKLLVQQSKMAAIGEMIGAIAHQWRQPLNTIALMVQDMEEAFNFGELDKEYIHKAVNSTMAQISYMSATIDDFRNFFKPDKEKIEFDINLAIKEVLRLVKDQLLGANISIEYNCSCSTDCEDKHNTIGYPNEFKQVILNIFNNAKDAIVGYREVSEVNFRGEIGINIESTVDVIRISISDNGGGIKEAHIYNIFKPYFSTKSAESGTGIGLYIAKTIIEKNMGGRLTVKNKAGGAEFIIELNTLRSLPTG